MTHYFQSRMRTRALPLLHCQDKLSASIINIDSVLHLFEGAFGGLKFTYETPKDSRLQYLDLEITMMLDHTCWKYKTKNEKGLLRYDSGHSKLVKCATACGRLQQSIKKSCDHKVVESVSDQAARLKKSVVSVGEKLLRSLNPRKTKK